MAGLPVVLKRRVSWHLSQLSLCAQRCHRPSAPRQRVAALILTIGGSDLVLNGTGSEATILQAKVYEASSAGEVEG
jgi:hypothetical protein